MKFNPGYLHLDIEEGKSPKIDVEAEDMADVVIMTAVIILKIGEQFEDDPVTLRAYKDIIIEKLAQIDGGNEDENY